MNCFGLIFYLIVYHLVEGVSYKTIYLVGGQHDRISFYPINCKRILCFPIFLLSFHVDSILMDYINNFLKWK